MYYAMKTYRGMDVYIHILSTLTPVGGDWLASSGRFITGKIASDAQWIGGWVVHRMM
jgi:hypothetical protein